MATDTTTSTASRQPSHARANRHVLSALVQNTPGVLAQVSGMFATRGYNIDSLAVGETENPLLSRITVVVRGDERQLEQVRKQLEKIVTVVKVHDISREDHVERELMLIKIRATAEDRIQVQTLVTIFRGRIVDVTPDVIMIEIAGQEKKIDAFIEAVREYGVLELARTGRIALVRGLPRGDESNGQAPAAVVEEAAPVVHGHSEL